MQGAKIGDFGGNFHIGEVTTGVGTEPMTIRKGCTRAEATAAKGKVLAGGAATAEQLLALRRVLRSAQFLQLSGGGGGCSLPHLTELLRFDVAEGDTLPELIRVYISLSINIGNTASGGVGTAAVPAQQAQSLGLR